MAFNDSPKFTNKGKQLMAAAIAGEITLKFVNIRLGDGELTTQAMASLTDLINPIVSLSINSIARGSNYVTLQTDFSNADLSAGFYWREIGVYAEDPEGGDDILYCYGNCGELAEYIAAAGEQSIKKIISMSVIVGDSENVTAEITDAVYYSPQDPLQNEISADDLIPFFAQLSGKKNMTFEILSNAILKLLKVVSTSADGLCPKRGDTTTKFLRDDGTWAVPPDTNTTYGVVSTSADGLCPKRGDTTTKFLRDDGTWAVPPDTNTTYGVVSTTANGLCPKRGGTTTKFLRDDGTWAVPPDTNTKNTAGSTDTSSKLFLIGATTQGANPVTYSHETCYVGADGCLYSDGEKVAVESRAGLKFAHGTVTLSRATGGTTVTYSSSISVGFKPKMLFAFGKYEKTADNICLVCFSDGTSGVVHAGNTYFTVTLEVTENGCKLSHPGTGNSGSGSLEYWVIG